MHHGTRRGAVVKTARATPDFHDRPVHNDVAVRGGTGCVWYASVAMFFVIKALPDNNVETHECAFVVWYKELNYERQHHTLCKKLKWEKTNGRHHCSVISVDSIVDTIHIVLLKKQLWGSSHYAAQHNDTFYLNKYVL
eukprot:TRINITY_DN7395_c0_g1_i3.p1 TRINITY_DN7395_c0_g1~~TRINITY_DN7395_c0_g1_i3.p1  ORF type:complete len:138 (-),score=0.80 TRINITY_DN7395_c0_g1_i3:21-434(-)